MAVNGGKRQDNAPQGDVKANDALEHTRGGKTTRDALDLGVPMRPGDPNEPIGPEDALDPNSRGDYSGRLGDANYRPHTTVRDEDGKVKIVDQRKAAEGSR